MSAVDRLVWLREVARRAQRDGLGFVLSRGFTTIRDALHPPWHELFWLPLGGLTPPPDVPTRRLLVVSEDDVQQEWPRLEPSLGRSARALVAQRLRLGALLLVLVEGEQVAGTLFVVPGNRWRFQHVVLTDRDGMVLDARVDPAFRGRGLFVDLLQRCAIEFAARGGDRLYVDASIHNEASLRSITRAGFQPLLRYRAGHLGYRYAARVIG